MKRRLIHNGCEVVLITFPLKEMPIEDHQGPGNRPLIGQEESTKGEVPVRPHGRFWRIGGRSGKEKVKK